MPIDVCPDWSGQDAYIIGGGASLRNFDFEALSYCNVIGCNYAYKHGSSICPRVLFCDRSFWINERDNVLRYGGLVYACHVMPDMKDYANKLGCGENLFVLGRMARGLSTQFPEVGFNSSTGATAINLALLFGASRVFLLGFDMKDQGGLSHWHDYGTNVRAQARQRHIRGMRTVAERLPAAFPGRAVYNVLTSPESSALDCFPTISAEEVFNAANN